MGRPRPHRRGTGFSGGGRVGRTARVRVPNHHPIRAGLVDPHRPAPGGGMTSRTQGESPDLKSPTGTRDGRSLAEPAPDTAASGAPKVVARQGVPSAVLPDPHP